MWWSNWRKFYKILDTTNNKRDSNWEKFSQLREEKIYLYRQSLFWDLLPLFDIFFFFFSKRPLSFFPLLCFLYAKRAFYSFPIKSLERRVEKEVAVNFNSFGWYSKRRKLIIWAMRAKHQQVALPEVMITNNKHMKWSSTSFNNHQKKH